MTWDSAYDRHHHRPKMDKYRPDYTTREGAERLKAKIEQALAKQRLPIPELKIELNGKIHRQELGFQPRFDIRSDMRNGYPPAIADKRKASA